MFLGCEVWRVLLQILPDPLQQGCCNPVGSSLGQITFYQFLHWLCSLAHQGRAPALCWPGAISFCLYTTLRWITVDSSTPQRKLSLGDEKLWPRTSQQACVLPARILHESIWLIFSLTKNIVFISKENTRREKERERNISVWLPLVHPQLGARPTTQACSLTGSQTSTPLVRRPALNPLSHTSQGQLIFLKTHWFQHWVVQGRCPVCGSTNHCPSWVTSYVILHRHSEAITSYGVGFPWDTVFTC